MASGLEECLGHLEARGHEEGAAVSAQLIEDHHAGLHPPHRQVDDFGLPGGRADQRRQGVHQRFSVSLPPALLEQLDEMTGEKGYDNRSLAIADMIRAQLIEHRQKSDSGEIAGTITLVYDHHKPHLQASLTDIQHDHHDAILSTVHVHLDHHNCLEVLIVRGNASVIRKIADELIAAKGVKHGKLTVTTTGKDLPSDD